MISENDEKMSFSKPVPNHPSHSHSEELTNELSSLQFTVEPVQLHTADQLQNGGDNYQTKPAVLSIVSSLHENMVQAVDEVEQSAWDISNSHAVHHPADNRPIIELKSIRLHSQPIFSILSSFCLKENDFDNAIKVIDNELNSGEDVSWDSITTEKQSADSQQSADRITANSILAVTQNMGPERLQGRISSLNIINPELIKYRVLYLLIMVFHSYFFTIIKIYVNQNKTN